MLTLFLQTRAEWTKLIKPRYQTNDELVTLRFGVRGSFRKHDVGFGKFVHLLYEYATNIACGN